MRRLELVLRYVHPEIAVKADSCIGSLLPWKALSRRGRQGRVSEFKIRYLPVLVAAASLLVTSASACSGGTSSEATTSKEKRTEASRASETSSTAITAQDFNLSLFDDSSASIDNEWVSFDPGEMFVWKGWTEEEEGERIPHRIVFIVTDMTKEINGIRAFVGWDRDYSAGRLIESELIFLAEDKAGNVWRLGEYTEHYDDENQLEGNRSWIVGYLDGAEAGFFMPAEQRLGTPAYSQGFAPPPYFWNDIGEVYKVGQKTCVPVGCYEDVVVIDESEPRFPGAHQLKYYARGVGNIRTGWRGDDADREVLVLTKVVHLSPEQQEKVRAAVLEHDARGKVYGLTPPVEGPTEAR
jgi:hypothetical protein